MYFNFNYLVILVCFVGSWFAFVFYFGIVIVLLRIRFVIVVYVLFCFVGCTLLVFGLDLVIWTCGWVCVVCLLVFDLLKVWLISLFVTGCFVVVFVIWFVFVLDVYYLLLDDFRLLACLLTLFGCWLLFVFRYFSGCLLLVGCFVRCFCLIVG